MSVNRFHPHVLVLPEDDANSQIANGFWLSPFISSRRIQVLPSAGGWHKALESFDRDHAAGMMDNANRLLVLLIDFDSKEDRLRAVKTEIPDELAERVFILGTFSEPEVLKRELRRSYEAIGLDLAKECHEGTNEVWSHNLLRHNAAELDRMRERLYPILFQPF